MVLKMAIKKHTVIFSNTDTIFERAEKIVDIVFIGFIGDEEFVNEKAKATIDVFKALESYKKLDADQSTGFLTNQRK